MNKTLIAGFAAGALLAATGAASAVEMKVSTWLSPEHSMNATGFPAIIDYISKVTDGRVTGKLEYNIAPPPAQFDLVVDGAADMAWSFHGYNPGRFITTKLIELPGYDGDAEAASVASWRAYDQVLKGAGENEGMVVIAMFTHGPGQLFMAQPITSLSDVAGKKIRIGGGVASDVGVALDVTGVRVPAPQVYETLQGGVADGVMMPYETMKSLNLIEVAPNGLEMPGGLYRGSFAVVMSQAFFDSLEERDQKAILDGREEMSRLIGAAWAAADVEGRKEMMEQGNVVEASPEDVAKFKELAGPIREKVKAEVAATGVDVDKAMQIIEDTFAEYRQPKMTTADIVAELKSMQKRLGELLAMLEAQNQ